MYIVQRHEGDLPQLRRLARRQKDAEQRDRYRAASLAIEGAPTKDIQRMLERSRGFVQRWVYVYRDRGIEAMREKPRLGRLPKLPRHREGELKARLDGGPLPSDGVCTLRGKDVRMILEREFGVRYSLDGVYDLLERLGYSCLKPRPRHEKNDPVAMKRFKKTAPLFSAPSGGR